jgi:hypothetical protein
MKRSFTRFTLLLSAVMVAMFATPLTYAQTGPAGVSSGIVMWLDASNVNNTSPASNPANTGSVAIWKDISGNGNNAGILSGQNTPKISTGQINGHDVVTFTRASATLGTVYDVSNVDIRATNMPKLTLFTVYKQGARGASDQQGIWGDDDGGWDRFFMTAFGSVDGIVSVGPPTNNVVITNAAGSGTKLLTTVYDNGAANGSTVYFNAVPVQSVTDNTHPTNAKSSLSIGWDGDNNPFDGDIAEMILYNRKLSDCEIKIVNRYLSQKYGVPFTTASISTSGNGYFCTGGSVTLTGTSSITGASFTWLRNGSLISGAASGTYSAAQAGSYQVIATVNGCSDTSVATLVKEVPSVIYVNAGVPASGNGASWGGALKTINEALDLVNNSSCSTEIWVKAGTYYPTTASGAATTSRDSSFLLTRNGIGIYGGFAGTETALAQRDPKTNLTVLSGDIGVSNSTADNSYSVVRCNVAAVSPAVTAPSVLDGFTIRDGNGNAGLPVTTYGTNNHAGGIFVNSNPGIASYLNIANCILRNNYGVYGGGLCTWARGVNGRTIVQVSKTVFTANQAIYGGAAMPVAFPGGGAGTTTFENCVFNGNTGALGGSFLMDADAAGSTLTTLVSNCTFLQEPQAPFYNFPQNGGSSVLTVNNSIIWKTGGNYQSITTGAGTTIFNNCNLALPATGSNINVDPLFANPADPDGADNIWATADDGIKLGFASVSLNAGQNALAPSGTDIAGAARIQQSIVDQGAYEGPSLICPGVSRLYVDGGVTASGAGGAWTTALKTVWEALTIANGCPGVNEIWVKAGTYYPMVSMLTQATSRDSSFRIVRNGIKIYGGFAGTETQLSSRNVTANPTILSGDINAVNDNTDNSWHVMTIVGGVNGNIDTTTRLDGFTLTKGNANLNASVDVFGVYSVDADGGGLALLGSNAGNNCSPYIANCTFSNNNANVGGGAYCGAYLGGASSPYFADCIFRNNSANDAGAVHAYTGVVGGGTLNPRFYRTKFLNNAASGGGGALGFNNGGFSTNLVYTESCVFSGNTASGNGGAFNTYSGNANLTAVNSVFADNTANNGGAIRTGSGTTTIINSTFSNNSAAGGIGNTINTGGTANITNSIIWGAGATQVQNGTVIYDYSDVRGITPTANSFSLDPLFVNAADADGADDIWGTADDGLLLQKCSPAIDKGSNALVPTDITLDVAGAARVQQTIVDMGAYESVMSGSYTWMTGVTGSNPTTCSGTDGFITIATAVTGRVYTLNYSRNGTPQSAVTLTGTAAGTVVLTGLGAGFYGGFTLTYNGCTSPASTGNVILIDPAAPAISSVTKADPTTCGGTDGSMTINGLVPSTAYSISYVYNGNTVTINPASTNGSGSYLISGLKAGVYSSITATRLNCSGTYFSSVTLNVPATPVVTASSNAPICSGNNLTLFANAIAGATYSWTGPNGFSSTAQNPSIASATVAAGGSYQVTVTVANCPSLPSTLNVVVNQTPAGVTAGSNSPVCSGNTINLTGASTTSGVTYAWSGPNSYASGVQSPSISGSTVAMSGTYTLTVSNAGATCTATATAAVVVRQTPAITGASGTGPLTCGGTSGTISITGLTASTAYTATFLKGTASQNGSGTTDASGVLTLTGLGQGSYSNFVVTSNGCASAAFAGPVTLSDPPIPVAPTASSNSPVCQGGTVNLSVTGLAGAIFSWTGPGSFTSTSATPTVTNLTSAKAGNYNVTQTIAGCVSPAATAVVVMNPLPSQPGTITGPASPCLGSTNTYSIASVTNASSYVWTIPSTWTSTGSGLSISAVTGTGAGTISVVAVNGCGNSTARTFSVTVNTVPAQPAAITGPAAICNGVSSSYSIAAVSNTSSYTWVLPTGWSGSSTTNTISATPDASSGTIYVFPNNVCGSGNSQSINVAVTSIPAQPGAITGSVAPCIGSTQQYYIAPVSGAVSYAWTYPAGGTPAWSGPATGTSVNAAVGAASGNISVTATNGCGTGPARNLQISTVPVPSAAGVISGNAAPCIGATEIYRIAAVANATSYSWSFPATWSGVSTSNQISLVAGAGSGTVTVTPIGVCGNGTPATLNVSGTPIVTPSVSLSRSTATDTICAGSSVTFTATPVNGGTTPLYTFRRNGNVVASGGASAYTTSSLSSGDRISVTMSSSLPCVSLSQVRDSIRMIVLPVRTPGININTQPPTALCAGTTIALNTNDTNGGSNPTYQWYLNGGQITGATMPQYTPPAINDGDTFQVVMTSNIACPKFTIAPSNKIGFRVLPIVTPSVSISSNPAGPVPRGTEVTFTATPSNGGPNPLFQWYRNGVEVSGATGPTWTSSSLSTGDQITVRMISDAACPAPELVMSNVIRMNVGSTGVAQVAGSFDGNVRLYPNPNTGRFTVEASNVRIQPGTRCGIDVLNALGQTVYHMVFQPDRASWSHDVFLNEGIANGTYMLRIYAENGGASGIPFVLNR